MPNGKPAGVRCVQLTDDLRCMLFGMPERPVFCGTLQPNEQMCGASSDEALHILTLLEIETRPEGPNP